MHVMLAILLVAGMVLYGPEQGQSSAEAAQQQEKYIKVAAADNLAAGLTDVGRVYVWGMQAWSGGGSRYGGEKPILVPLPDEVMDIAAGYDTLYFLMADKTVMALGGNYEGQAGNGTYYDVMVPTHVFEAEGVPLTDVSKISAGYLHALALKDDGSVWVWGGDEDTILGVPGEYYLTYAQPVISETDEELQGIADIVAGFDFNLAISGSGELYTWGNDLFGQLANGSGENSRNMATLASGHLPESVFAGTFAQHAFYIDSVTGAVYGWGQNDRGQVMPGGSDSFQNPVDPDLSEMTASVKEIRVGFDHTLILAEDGTVWGMGNSEYGQLTDVGNELQQLSPDILKDIVSIEAGYRTSYALNVDGKILAFGLNYNYQLGTDQHVDDIVWEPVEVGEPGDHTVSLSGKVIHGETGMPLANVPLRISHMYGWKTAVTDMDGNYQFDVLPSNATYQLEATMPDYYYVGYAELFLDQSRAYDLEVYEQWKDLFFFDLNESPGFLDGAFRWTVAEPLTVEDVEDFRLYFESEDGEKMDPIEIDSRFPHFLYLRNIQIPEGAAYIRMYVDTDDLAEGCESWECPLPFRVPVFDNPDRTAEIIETEFGDKIHLKFKPPADASDVVAYEVVHAEYFNGSTILHSLGIHPAGQDLYEGEYDYPDILGDYFDGNHLYVRLLFDEPAPEPDPGDSRIRILRFFDEDYAYGEVSGNLIFRGLSGASEQDAYVITARDTNGASLGEIGLVNHANANDEGILNYEIGATFLPSDTARIGVHLAGDEQTLTMVAVWDNPGLQFLDVNPNTGEIHGELWWEQHADDEMIQYFGVQLYDDLTEWSGRPVEEVIIEPNLKRGAVQKSVWLDEQKSPESHIALVGYDADGSPVAWAVVPISDTDYNDWWYSDWFSPQFRDLWKVGDRFSVVDVMHFQLARNYDLTGDGEFDELDLDWLLRLIEPVNPLNPDLP